jgi:hypothetical protein
MGLTLGEASRQSGKSKQAILECIKKGRMSAARDDFKRWDIDPAELFRVYPKQIEKQNLTEHFSKEQQTIEITYLKDRAERLEKDLSAARVDGLRWQNLLTQTQEAKDRAAAEAQAALLAAVREAGEARTIAALAEAANGLAEAEKAAAEAEVVRLRGELAKSKPRSVETSKPAKKSWWRF